ncbi:hypothetical protein V8G54_014891, partial [Vigna mungo]
SHLSSIKIVVVSGSIVAFGGNDDTINLYDLSSASVFDSLHQHSAIVTTLSFYAPPNVPFPYNLIFTNIAGSLAIFDADNFFHLTTLSIHCNATINDLVLYPFDECALTIALTTALSSSTSSTVAAIVACTSTILSA